MGPTVWMTYSTSKSPAVVSRASPVGHLTFLFTSGTWEPSASAPKCAVATTVVSGQVREVCKTTARHASSNLGPARRWIAAPHPHRCAQQLTSPCKMGWRATGVRTSIHASTAEHALVRRVHNDVARPACDVSPLHALIVARLLRPTKGVFVTRRRAVADIRTNSACAGDSCFSARVYSPPLQ